MLRIITFLSLGLALAYGEDSQVQAVYAERRPELVSLMVVNSFAIPIHTCSGFVVNYNTIVTAARCLYDHEWESVVPLHRHYFRAGSPFLNSGGIIYDVNFSSRFTHFHPSHMQMDVAFLGTSFTILFGDNVKPANVGGYEVAEGDQLHTAGWGYLTYPEIRIAEFDLQHEMPQVAVNWEDCKAIYEDYGFELLEDTFCTQLENQVSIINPEEQRQKCFGEAGGPVYHNGVVVGVRSFDVNCTAALPSVNTRTSSYVLLKSSMPMTIMRANSDA